MPDLVLTGRAQAVIDNVADVLKTVTTGGKPAFAAVGLYDDLPSFLRTSDPLKGRQCGVIAKQPERSPSADNGAEYVERMGIDIAVRFSMARIHGADEAGAALEAQRLAEAVRVALMADPHRGGNTELIVWNGRLLAATDVSGTPKTINGKPNEAFHTFTVPVVCGWEI